MGAHRYRLPLALVAGAAAAAVATLLLRPRGADLDPLMVEPTAYFSAAELVRADAYAGPQRLIGLAGIVLSGGTLAILALRPPRALGALLERAAARPLLAGAAFGAGLTLVLTAVGLPLSLIAHERAVAAGLSTQELAAWLGDLGKATAIGMAEGAGAGFGVVLLLRRCGELWWLAGAAATVALAIVFTFAAPVVLEPRFNSFDRLPEGSLRSSVLDLAKRAGVTVGEVYEVDASRRTTAVNAYVGGLGPTKRVVLYDTLLNGFDPPQVESVVAHELAHVEADDVWRGILWLAIVALPATFLVDALARRISPAGPARPVAWLPALTLSAAVVSFLLGIPSGALSRAVERHADARAIALTGNPRALIQLQRRLALTNLSDPDPPPLLQTLFGSHPTTVERIGAALAAERR